MKLRESRGVWSAEGEEWIEENAEELFKITGNEKGFLHPPLPCTENSIIGALSKGAKPIKDKPKFNWNTEEFKPITSSTVIGQIFEWAGEDSLGNIIELYRDVTFRDLFLMSFEVDILLEQTTQPFSD